VWVTFAVLLGLAIAGYLLAAPHVRAWYHLRAARSELERYHNPQAIRHLQVCMSVWPEDPDVLLLVARATRRARVYGDAEISLKKYQKLRGLDAACSFEQLLLSAERQVDQVAGLCRRYVEKGHPETPLILEALTRGYLRQYQLPAARFCLDRWLQSQPDNPQALCLKGELYLDYQHARSAALVNYRRAVKLDPDHEEARLGLAVTLLEFKNFAEAAEHLQFLRQRQPDNLRVEVGLAECFHGMGQGDRAERLVEGVLERAPQFVPALVLRGRLALDRQQFAAAETWLRQAVRLDPSHHQARYNLVLCLHHNRKDREERRHRRRLDQMEKALKRFHTIVTRDLLRRPNDPALHYTLGRLLLRSGHRQEGLRWLQSALRQDPNYAPARRALATYYSRAHP
jgi:tetratricopeptide (TPR) repeat protein